MIFGLKIVLYGNCAKIAKIDGFLLKVKNFLEKSFFFKNQTHFLYIMKSKNILEEKKLKKKDLVEVLNCVHLTVWWLRYPCGERKHAVSLKSNCYQTNISLLDRAQCPPLTYKALM